MGEGFAKPYDARRNAVVAACGKHWPRMRLSGGVTFPELDMALHQLPSVEVDLNEKAGDQCDELDALLKTVDWRQPESSLRTACGTYLAWTFAMAGRPMCSTEPNEWELELDYHYGMASTCNLVALAYLWHRGQYGTQPAMLHRFGVALDHCLAHAETADRQATLHALAYLVRQLPPQDLASLIVHTGNLTLDQRHKVQAVAVGTGPEAAAARGILGPPE